MLDLGRDRKQHLRFLERCPGPDGLPNLWTASRSEFSALGAGASMAAIRKVFSQMMRCHSRRNLLISAHSSFLLPYVTPSLSRLGRFPDYPTGSANRRAGIQSPTSFQEHNSRNLSTCNPVPTSDTN